MQNAVTAILGIKYPLVQAPMAWVTDAKLVAAVSKAGGLGVLGTHAGQTVENAAPDFLATQLQQQIQAVQAETVAPFAVNIEAPRPEERVADHPVTAALLPVAFAAEVPVFAIVGTPHAELFDLIKAHGGKIIFRPMTPDVAQMQLAEKLGADILVATGSDEGGLLPEQDYGTFTVVPAMVDAVSIPVLAAGGINDRRGVQAAYALGAAGVYVGTRFLATKEAPMAVTAKDRLIASTYQDLVAVSPVQRSIATVAAKALVHNDHPLPNAYSLLPAMRLGAVEDGVITVNTGIDVIRDIPSVADLIQRLMN
ncbi:nitronate monooxygenase [Loigolactobacillus coryniformis]|uniref:NAD(P)H-dependent flavin oxidoreductase n=1 Tax=Loigolactobacillus coryniformis TaxID=1610 RepID=UPI00201AB998|nr:nitronate monooxygenase [Loigolactobacillus coryniformis]MCL5459504.1 nitronate monooxygenase [Loigolactobacillus coryniformis]